MSLEIRAPRESEREGVADVLQTSLNLDPARRAGRLARMPLADFRIAVDGPRVVSTASEFRFLQWFGGRRLAMSGISGVATLPEYRGGGTMRDVVTRVMREAYDRGTAASALYPAVLGPYRSLGYELGGVYHQHQLRIDAIPADIGDASVVREYTPEDLPAVRTCWSRAIRHASGTIEPTGDAWWVSRTFDTSRDPTSRAVVVPGDDGGVDAFASFTRSPTTGILDIEFGLECEPLAAVSERGLRTLLAYFRGYRGVGQWLRWAWAPHDPVAMLIPEHAVQTHWRFPWMFRLLHLEGALRGRDWPPGVRTEALFAVEDPLFRANTGTWRLTLEDGEAGVVREADHAARKPIPIGALSSMFSGYLRPADAVRLGLLAADDQTLSALTALLAGPDPWSPFFF